MPHVTLQLEAGRSAFTVVVEPWASPEFMLEPRQRAAIVLEHPSVAPRVTCGVIDGVMYVTVYQHGSTFKFMRGDVIEFETPQHLATPRLSGEADGTPSRHT